MRIEEVRGLPVRDRFLYWIRERHAIYLRRKAGMPKPWSDDEIFRNWSFTNPYRENDKVTRWYKEHLREPLADDPGILFATIAFRWFNWPPTGELLLGGNHMEGWHESWDRRNLLVDWDLPTALARLHCQHDTRDVQVFTGAYNISNAGSKRPKIEQVCDRYVRHAWHRAPSMVGAIKGGHLHDAHRFLSELEGMGGSGFMAAQVVCDLKYTYLLEGAPDWWSWCSPGPGSMKGLNRLLGFPPEKGWKPEPFRAEVNQLRERVTNSLPKHPPFHAQDLQNCLCEFFKYETVLAGGRAKRRYAGT